MKKIKIISEYTYNTFYDDLADSLTGTVNKWATTNDVNIISVTTNLHNIKNEDDSHVIVMTANIIYE